MGACAGVVYLVQAWGASPLGGREGGCLPILSRLLFLYGMAELIRQLISSDSAAAPVRVDLEVAAQEVIYLSVEGMPDSWVYGGQVLHMVEAGAAPGDFDYSLGASALNPPVRVRGTIFEQGYDYLLVQPVNYAPSFTLVIEDGPGGGGPPGGLFFQVGATGYQTVPNGFSSNAPSGYFVPGDRQWSRVQNVPAGFYFVEVSGAEPLSVISFWASGQQVGTAQVDSMGDVVTVVGQPAVGDIETRQPGNGQSWLMSIAECEQVV